MKLCDLHCDTAGEIWKKRERLRTNSLHISLDKAEFLENYIQLTAVFTRTELSDSDGWYRFIAVRENLIDECRQNGIPLVRTGAELSRASESGKTAFILTVEDARILDGRVERVRELYELGVRVITPLWGGLTCIGGSHNTEAGLTDFGKTAVAAMCECGIIPDISHASFKSADDIMDICEKYGKAPIATHMNSYTAAPHSRNLTDERYMRLTSLGGIAGVSLCPPHLSADGKATSADVIRHIMHYRSLKSGHVSLGCDLDGTGLPSDMTDITSLGILPDLMKKEGLTETEIEGVCYGTARDFLIRNLP